MTSRERTSHRIVRSSLGSTVAVTLAGLVSLAVTPILVDGLEPADYGAWATLGGIAVLVSLSDIGLRTEVIRRVAVAIGQEDDAGVAAAVNEGVGALLRVGALVVLATAAGVVGLWPTIFGDVAIDGLPAIAAALVVIALAELVNSTFHAVLTGAQLAHWEQLGRVTGTVVSAVVGAVAVSAGAGLGALVAARAAGLVLTLSIQHFAVRRALPYLRFRPARPSRNAGWLALPALALVSQVADVVDSQTDKVVIASVSGTAAVASYHVGTTLVVQVRAALLSALAPLLPGLTETRVHDEPGADRLYRQGAVASYVVGLPLLGTVAVLGGPFISLWIPAPLPDAAQICAVFGLGMTLNLLSAPLTLRALAESRHRIVATSAALNIVTNGCSSIALTLWIGPVGAAYGSVIGTVAGMAYIIWMFGRSSRDTPVPAAPRLIPVLAWFVALALAGVPKWTPTWPALMAATAAVGATALLLVGVPNRAELPTPAAVRTALRRRPIQPEVSDPAPRGPSPI